MLNKAELERAKTYCRSLRATTLAEVAEAYGSQDAAQIAAALAEDEKENAKNSMWQVNGSRYAAINTASPTLKSGEYTFSIDPNGTLWASRQESVTDGLIGLPDLPTDFILNQIKTFWSKTTEYAKYGWLQKRGILLYGPPGCGKSSIIALLKHQIIENQGVVFGAADEGYTDLIAGLKSFRNVEPTRPCMTVVEDIETYLESSNNSNVAKQEKEALSLYDGENQINHVVHLATTNKPDAVADRFIRRPGRFDLVIEIHTPTAKTREAYLRSIGKGNISDSQIQEIVAATGGLSLAYMREIATTYLVLGIPLDETITRLNKNKKEKFTGKEGFSVGFTGGE